MSDVVWADLARDVVSVTGVDAGTFLHSQLAQDIAAVQIGRGVHSLLLDPTGHVVALVRVTRHGEHHYTIDVEAGHGQSVIDRLRRFVLRSDVVMTISNWCVRGFRGDDIAEISATETVSVTSYWTPAQGIDVVGPCEVMPTIGEQTEPEHLDMLRVDARWPRLGQDILVGDIPATTGVVSVAVSFTKGCYPGQELVERMDSRGSSAPVVIRSLERQAVAVGAPLSEEGNTVGTITSMGKVLMLARVSRHSALGMALQ